MFKQLLNRELLRYWRKRQDLMNPLVFFLITVSLFPLAVTPEDATLTLMSGGILWVCALLAAMLSLESMYRDDYLDGTLEWLIIQSGTPYQVIMAKVVSHWLTTGLPLVVISPVLGVMLFLPQMAMLALILSLLIGTMILSLIGSVGMGLTVGLRQSGVLLSMLVLPLFIPVLIFGASAVSAAAMGLDYTGQLAYLGAYLALSLAVVPYVSVAAVKVSIH